MRIAVVHSFYSEAEPSGENVVVEAQLEALRAAGHEVRLVQRRTDDLKDSVLYRARAAKTVASGRGPDPTQELAQFAPDVVHIHNLFPNFGTSWLDDWDGPVVATLHNFRSICAAATLYRDGATCTLCPDNAPWSSVRYGCYRNSRVASIPLALATAGGPSRNPLLRRPDRLICLTTRSANVFASYGVAESRISVLPNFVDVREAPPQPPTMRRGWLYAGRLTAEKGVLELLDIWPKGESLDIVGSGPLSDAVQRRTSDSVSFLGSLDHGDLLSSLSTFEGLIIPSRWFEGLPTVLLEALAAGLPVLAADQNAAADEVARLEVGAVFDFGRPESLEASMNQVRSDSNLSARCFAAAQQFTQTAWLNQVIPLYDRVIGVAGGHSRQP